MKQRCVKPRFWVVLVGTLGLAVGCGKAPSPRFDSNLMVMDKYDISFEQQQDIANALAALFGTPDDPYVPKESGLDKDKIKLAAGPTKSDKAGVHTGLYREHCAHCHGISGNGMGPTAAFLKPYPRDYREGWFKFKSTERAEMPTNADLERILRHGIPGTSMPAFEVALVQPEIEALVEYVKYLSLRGMVEIELARQTSEELGEGERLPTTAEFLVEGVLKPQAEKWSSAETKLMPVAAPPADFGSPASIAAGKSLFYDVNKANCLKCHGTTALGDGVLNDYDQWNKDVAEFRTKADATLASLTEQRGKAEEDFATAVEALGADSALSEEERKQQRETLEKDKAATLKKLGEKERMLPTAMAYTLVPRYIEPRNLRMGVYRGGRRPLDVYYRIHSGINGTPMPAIANLVADSELPADLSEEEKTQRRQSLQTQRMWNIVDYVLSLPYEPGGELGADISMLGRERN